MIRKFKRTVLGWKAEFALAAGKVNTFKRIVLAIIVVIAVVFGARKTVIDPLRKQLAENLQKLEKDGVPAAVPPVQDDSEVQEEQLKAENLVRNVAEWERKAKATLAGRRQITLTNRSDVLSEFERTVAETGMMLRNRSPYVPVPEKTEDVVKGKKGKREPAKPKGKSEPAKTDSKANSAKAAKAAASAPPEAAKSDALPKWSQQYEFAGTFAALCECLKKIDGFPYPAQIRNVQIQLFSGDSGEEIAPEPRLNIQFVLDLYYHEQ